MKDHIIERITKSPLRRSLFHFTRESNLPAIDYFDSLISSYCVSPSTSDRFREKKQEMKLGEWRITLNPHLRISDTVMHPGTSLNQFRTELNQHVFFWPTKRDCRKMIDTYKRREPNEKFVVIQLNAFRLIHDHFNRVKLTKYDSGSSPRYPGRCSYKKSLRMFLPIAQFGSCTDELVPTKPSEIREVLVFQEVTQLSNYLQIIYCEPPIHVPERWQQAVRSFDTF